MSTKLGTTTGMEVVLRNQESGSGGDTASDVGDVGDVRGSTDRRDGSNDCGNGSENEGNGSNADSDCNSSSVIPTFSQNAVVVPNMSGKEPVATIEFLFWNT